MPGRRGPRSAGRPARGRTAPAASTTGTSGRGRAASSPDAAGSEPGRLRSPTSSRGPGKDAAHRERARSWRTFQPGTNDRCAVTTVNGPAGPSTTAASATRGSSGTVVSPRLPGTSSGRPKGAGPNRRTRQDSTGRRDTSATPYDGPSTSTPSSEVDGVQAEPGVPSTAGTKRDHPAPSASATHAVWSVPPERSWLRSTSCSPTTSASSIRAAVRRSSTRTAPSGTPRPLSRLNVATRTGRPYAPARRRSGSRPGRRVPRMSATESGPAEAAALLGDEPARSLPR